MRKILVRTILGLVVAVAGLAVWIAIDLSRSFKTDIRSFDPDEVARLDTAMWRSYYEREHLRLFRELGELLDHQYRFPFWRRQLVAFHAARAAFVFKDGKSRNEYLKALPDLESFYKDICDFSTLEFDSKRAAELEVEWWIVHRERKKYQQGDLSRALAETVAVIYGLPAERFKEHADLRAEAMTIRDTRAEAGGVTEHDWQQIDNLLHRSWRSLYSVVHAK